MSENDLLESYAGLEGAQLLRALLRDFRSRIAIVSSFGAESAVLLHMVSEMDRAVPVIFLDTGKLFDETLEYRDHLVALLGLQDVRSIAPNRDCLRQEDANGLLHNANKDLCCDLRKARPLEGALQGFSAVISGRKRFHGGERQNLQAVSLADGRLKAEPLASFSGLDIANYLHSHDLPPHPLVEAGYRSIGCAPCTSRGGTVDNPRAGRWAGQDKTECGIHWTADGRLVRISQAQGALSPTGC
jgi:phosphoadenosine phosphosulfate reductase